MIEIKKLFLTKKVAKIMIHMQVESNLIFY